MSEMLMIKGANKAKRALINEAKAALARLNSAACRWIPLAPRWPASYACPMLNIYPASRVAPCGWREDGNNGKGSEVVMTPTNKSEEIERFLTDTFGHDRREVISANKCVPKPIGCGGDASKFREERSYKEYQISGLRQKCQDSFFGV